MHLGLRFIAIVAVACIVLISSAVGLFQAFFRSWTLPICWRCGSRPVRPSSSRRGRDIAVRFVMLIPYRCPGCRCRFYGFRTQRVVPQPHT